MTWTPIDGTPYEVSDTGGVRRNGRLLRPYTLASGYLMVTLHFQGQKQRRFVHRLVLGAFRGPSPLWTDHKNANKQDNRLENLEYVTPAENRQRAQALGLQPRRYTRHTRCTHGHRLTPDNVRMRADKAGRLFQACLACGRINQARYAARKRARETQA